MLITITPLFHMCEGEVVEVLIDNSLLIRERSVLIDLFKHLPRVHPHNIQM